MIKLVAKQKIGFRNPETGEIVTAEPYAFATLPDWITKDPMYGWAQEDGSIEIGSEPKDDKTPKDGDVKDDKTPKPPKDGDVKDDKTPKPPKDGDVKDDKTPKPPKDGDKKE